MDGMGTAHYVRRNGDRLDRHEGPVERCQDPGCAWPRIGSMVTVTSGGRRVTGDLTLKKGNRVEVTTGDGTVHPAPRVTVQDAEWGAYCPHGTKLIEAVPAEHTCDLPKEPCDRSGDLGHLCIDHQPWCRACHPDGRKIKPWPCDEEGCTEEDFDREQREMEEAYWEEMNASLHG